MNSIMARKSLLYNRNNSIPCIEVYFKVTGSSTLYHNSFYFFCTLFYVVPLKCISSRVSGRICMGVSVGSRWRERDFSE